MVAEAVAVVKRRGCTGAEEAFCRLIAFDGKKPTQAYRTVWGGKYADRMAFRVMARQHVIDRIEEMRAMALRRGLLRMEERRALLAETARAVPKKLKATHTERIAAIREDAHLAGERRTDGGTVTIAAHLSAGVILDSLGALPIVPADQPTDAVVSSDVLPTAPASAPALPPSANPTAFSPALGGEIAPPTLPPAESPPALVYED